MKLSKKENNTVEMKTSIIKGKVERALSKIEKEHNIEFVNFQMLRKKNEKFVLYTFTI